MQNNKNIFKGIAVGSCLILILGLYFLFTENQEKLFSLIASCFGVFGFILLFQNPKIIPSFLMFITPLSVDYTIGGGTKLSMPLEIVLIVLIGVSILLFLIKRPTRFKLLNHPISWLLAAFIVSMFLSTLNSSDIMISIKRTISFAIYVVGFYVFTIILVKNTAKLSNLFLWYILGMLIPIINSIINHAKWDFAQPASIYSALPFYDEHTVFGACLAFIIPFSFNRIGLARNKKFNFLYLLITLILLSALLQSYSRAAWISLFVGGLFYLFIKLKGSFTLFLSIVVTFATLFWFNYNSIYLQMRRNKAKYSENISQHLASVTNLRDDSSNRERINRWVCALRMFEKKPLLGFGPGMYQFEYGKFQTDEFTTRISTHRGDMGNAHSEYLMAISETGVVGFIIFLMLVLKSISLGMNILKKKINQEEKIAVFSALIGLCTFYIHGMFNAFSDSPKMAILLMMSLAILVSIDKNQSNSSQKL